MHDWDERLGWGELIKQHLTDPRRSKNTRFPLADLLRHNDAERPSRDATFRLIGRGEAIDSPQLVVLDMDSTEIPFHGRQEQSAYTGQFESTCNHPLLLFNGEGDC